MQVAVPTNTRLDRLAWALIAGWVAYAALGMNVFGKAPWPDGIVDYRLIYDFSHSIVATQTYPAKHCYPPSAIIIHYAASQLPYPLAAAVYLLANMAATLACCALIVGNLQSLRHPGAGVLALAGFVATSPYIIWELRSQNCNMFFLLGLIVFASALIRGADRTAGASLAFSFSLKLFSVMLIPYLAWSRRYRALAWTLAGLGLFWVILPLAVFGTQGFVPVYSAWWDQLRANARAQADPSHPILISLHNSGHWLSQGDPALTTLLVRVVAGLWLGIAAIWWWSARRRGAPSPAQILGDVGILVLGPTAISPYLEAYHLVPVLILSMVFAHEIVSPSQPSTRRLALAACFSLSLVFALGLKSWKLRGLWVNASVLLAALGVIAAQWVRPNREKVVVIPGLREAA